MLGLLEMLYTGDAGDADAGDACPGDAGVGDAGAQTPSLSSNCFSSRACGETLERQPPPLIFRWLLGKAAQSRIIGSLSVLRWRDTPPRRLALTTLYAIDFSFSKAGIKQERNGGSRSRCVSVVLVLKSSRDGRRVSGHVGGNVWWSGARAGDFQPNRFLVQLQCPLAMHKQ